MSSLAVAAEASTVVNGRRGNGCPRLTILEPSTSLVGAWSACPS
jgi:hypothetical protein